MIIFDGDLRPSIALGKISASALSPTRGRDNIVLSRIILTKGSILGSIRRISIVTRIARSARYYNWILINNYYETNFLSEKKFNVGAEVTGVLPARRLTRANARSAYTLMSPRRDEGPSRPRSSENSEI